MYGKGFAPLSILTAVAVAASAAMVFFYAPLDADQGFIQKIFYVHVPMAIVGLLGFVAGGVFGFLHLRSGDRAHDLRSYVAIHLSIVLAVGVLATGAIWAKASWGHWWVWSEPMLTSYLIIFLLYCCYQPLRFSIEDPDRQARAASVFAVTAGVFVPVNFMAVRAVESVTHPRVLSTAGSGMPAEMAVTFLVSLLAMGLLFATLWKLELSGKQAAIELRRLRARLELDAERSEPLTDPRRAAGAGAVPAGQ